MKTSELLPQKTGGMCMLRGVVNAGVGIALGFGATTTSVSAAEPARVLSVSTAAAAFGLREEVEQISLSPDGKQVAYIAPYTGQGSVLVVRGVADDAQPRAIANADGKPNRLGGCHWVSNTRLV